MGDMIRKIINKYNVYVRNIIAMICIGYIALGSSFVEAETIVSHERQAYKTEKDNPMNQQREMILKKDSKQKENKIEYANDKDSHLAASIRQKQDIKTNKNIFHGVSVYTTKNDTDEECYVALLDAKRIAVEQAGTYVDIYTDMKNFKITNDDVKVMSSAVVKLVPDTIKKQIISNENNIKVIRVEADFEVNINFLKNELINKSKDLQLMIDKHYDFVSFYSVYNAYKEDLSSIDVSISLTVQYFNKWKKMNHDIGFRAWRTQESELPVMITDKNPLTFIFYPIEDEKPEILSITPSQANNFTAGDISFFSFSLDSAKYIANWQDFKVVIKYYLRDGTAKEVEIPQRVLKQWHDIIVTPKLLMENY